MLSGAEGLADDQGDGGGQEHDADGRPRPRQELAGVVHPDHRNGERGAQGVKDRAKAENQFESALKSLFAVSENYPQLRATENFQQLQAELTDTEDKIMASRRFYNGVVRDFNTKRKVFPTNIFANMLGFKDDKEYFELDEANLAAASEPVKAKF